MRARAARATFHHERDELVFRRPPVRFLPNAARRRRRCSAAARLDAFDDQTLDEIR
jgi:hypothetical protein